MCGCGCGCEVASVGARCQCVQVVFGMARGEPPTSKAEWVWLMVTLAKVDRGAYRILREQGWNHVAIEKLLVGKSDKTN